MDSTNTTLSLNVYGFLTKKDMFPESPLNYIYNEEQLKVIRVVEYFGIPIYFPYVKCENDYVGQIFSLLKKKDNKICFSIPFITGVNSCKYSSAYCGERFESKQEFYKAYYFRKDLVGGTFKSLEIASMTIEDFCVPTSDQIELFNFLKEEKLNGSIQELGFNTVTSKTGIFNKGQENYLSLFTFVSSAWSYAYFCLKRSWVEAFVSAARERGLRIVLMGHTGRKEQQPLFTKRFYTQYLLKHLVDEIRVSMTNEVFVNENYNRFDRKPEWQKLPDPKTDRWVYSTLPLEQWIKDAGCIGCNQCDYYCPKDLYPSFCFAEKKEDPNPRVSVYLLHAKETCNSCGDCEKVCPQRLSIIPLVLEGK